MSDIKVRELSKTFESKDNTVEAVKNINLTIQSGDIYVIIGMSGAGKSTLVRCLNFLEQPTSGEVWIGDKSLGELTDRELRSIRCKIAMIFQHFNLLMQKNVIDNVCFPLRLKGVKKAAARKRAAELLDVVGLSDKAKSYPSQLSGGQKQRTAIARALACDPEILLCDEATSALDPQTTASILKLLQEINQRLGITIVLITHQMSVVRQICSHVAIMESGNIVEEGRVEDIFSHPKTQTAKYLIIGENQEEKENNSWQGAKRQQEQITASRKLRMVFSQSSAYEPIVANMVLEFGVPVNILRADTKNVGGITKGEMILGLPKQEGLIEKVQEYLHSRGVESEEVTGDVLD
jgi:D-methionine transport system ATP-binding protein